MNQHMPFKDDKVVHSGPAIVAKGLKKHYQLSRSVSVDALRGVDISVAGGEFVAIVGPSGSGKSTMLHLLGLLDRPTSGEIAVNGAIVTGTSRRNLTKLRRRSIGFVFQQYNLIPTLTAVENVSLPLRYTGHSRREAKEQAAVALEKVGLGGRLRHSPVELSGGEQQRVAIARALINKPAIVLADEPTGELDTENSAAIVQLLRTLNETSGQTIIIVTHNPEVATATDRVIKMRDGLIDQG